MRYKLTIEYDGTNYCGFQKQLKISQKSVEGVLNDAIFKLAQETPKITACGRTDSGVHANSHVIHFDLNKEFTSYRLICGLNNYLINEDVSILDCEIVDENFHSRFDAKMRHYNYILINRLAPLSLNKNRAWRVTHNLDINAMQNAAQILIGEHDFSSFRDADCQAQSPIKIIKNIEIIKNNQEITIKVSAPSFLQHMVRNIVGTLVWVGIGKIKASDIKNILQAKDRTKSGPNAPACGLYFAGVEY